jgi:hypothetical protein
MQEFVREIIRYRVWNVTELNLDEESWWIEYEFGATSFGHTPFSANII